VVAIQDFNRRRRMAELVKYAGTCDSTLQRSPHSGRESVRARQARGTRVESGRRAAAQLPIVGYDQAIGEPAQTDLLVGYSNGLPFAFHTGYAS